MAPAPLFGIPAALGLVSSLLGGLHPAPTSTSPVVVPSSTAAPITPPANIANVVSQKAGLSGYVGIQNIQAFKDLAPYIGWYSDYDPNTPDALGVQGVPMLWGATGSVCLETPGRQKLFQDAIQAKTPKLMFGFYEPGTKSHHLSTSNFIY